jgi:hypothetical protein
MKRILAAGAAALALAFGAGAAQAGVVVHVHINGTFNDGGAFSGWYNVNPSPLTIPKWDIATTAGSAMSGDAYRNGADQTAGDFSTYAVFAHYFTYTNYDALALAPLGANSLAAVEGNFLCHIGCQPDSLRYGTATFSYTLFLPEPRAWALMIVGLGLAGAGLRRRPLAALA